MYGGKSANLRDRTISAPAGFVSFISRSLASAWSCRIIILVVWPRDHSVISRTYLDSTLCSQALKTLVRKIEKDVSSCILTTEIQSIRLLLGQFTSRSARGGISCGSVTCGFLSGGQAMFLTHLGGPECIRAGSDEYPIRSGPSM
jgi:hypothetical protein